MKYLITTIAAVVLVGCGESQQSAPAPEAKPTEPLTEAAKPKPPRVKTLDISIHSAAEQGNTEAINQLLDAGTDVNLKQNFTGYTALHYAAKAGNKNTTKNLIDNGADVNAISNVGLTPLIEALFVNDPPLEIIEHLISAGSDVNIITPAGFTALDVAKLKFSTLLRKHGAKTAEELKAAVAMSIHDAAKEGDTEALKQHLAAGEDVNAKDKHARTPLHFAAGEGYKEIAELLIVEGANVDAKDKYGTTPLHNAVFTDFKVAELLITKNAAINIMNDVGNTALDWAIRDKNYIETADLLRKHGGKTGAELKAAGN